METDEYQVTGVGDRGRMSGSLDVPGDPVEVNMSRGTCFGPSVGSEELERWFRCSGVSQIYPWCDIHVGDEGIFMGT